MLLSRLIYEVVKSTLDLGNEEFIYSAFRAGDFDNDTDYSKDIANSFNEVNQAIHRLSDLRKIPYKVEAFKTNAGTSIVDFSKTGLKIKNIISIVNINSTNGSFTCYSFRNMGYKKVNIIGLNTSFSNSLFVEYIEDIPNFNRDDYNYSDEESIDVDLSDYGINETMCSKIILYASARLFAHIDPQISSKEEYLAEQYFDQLENHGTSFSQNKIEAKNVIGML